MDAHPLPANFESERFVCALALYHPEASSELHARGFRIEWLHSPACRTLWNSIQSFRSKVADTREVDLTSLFAGLQQNPERLAEIGGPAAITDVASIPAILTSDRIDYHSAILRLAWQRREALKQSQSLLAAAWSGDEFESTLSRTINSLGNLSVGAVARQSIGGDESMREFLDDLEANRSGDNTAQLLKTLIPEIDDKLVGLGPGLWLIGAETSGGKTAFTLQLVRSVLDQGGRVLVFALEMSHQQLIRRLVSAYGRIPMHLLANPQKLTDYDCVRITRDGSSWNASNLRINDNPDLTIQEIRSIARAEHAREPLSMVVVDYLQLASAGKFRDSANREQEVSYIGAQCVKMAKELGIPVLAPTQLNDEGKVRESRALAHHASVYLVIQSDGILCAKGRDAERGWSIPYKLLGDIQTFERRC